MRLLVTGANGFIGQYVVASALRAKHRVVALVRPHAEVDTLSWHRHPHLMIRRADLRSRAGLEESVAGVEAVIHLAAATRGDFYTRFAGTVTATENLLDAMTQVKVRHIVMISSFAVYDYLRKPSWATLDEESPLESKPFARHAYAHTKLIQEQLVRAYAERHDWIWTILRPGAVWGKDRYWTSRLGLRLDRWWIRLGTWAPLPLTYVENCADVVVRAADCPAAAGEVLNIVDDRPPTQRRFMAELKSRIVPCPRIIPVPWTVLRIIAGCASLANRALFQGRAKVPTILVPRSLHAGAKPLRYPNRKVKEVLGWQPRYDLNQALARCFGDATVVGSPPGRIAHSSCSHARTK